MVKVRPPIKILGYRFATQNTNQYIRVLHGKHKPEINIVINIMVSVRNIVIVKTPMNELVIKRHEPQII